MDALRERLRGPPPLILDGGLGSALEARGVDISCSKLWSARLLCGSDAAEVKERAAVLRGVHLDFLRAGADVITTASYQVEERTRARRCA